MLTSYTLYECSCDTCDLIQRCDWFAFPRAKPITERFTSVPQAFSRPPVFPECSIVVVIITSERWSLLAPFPGQDW